MSLSGPVSLALVLVGSVAAHGFQLEQLTCAPPSCGVFRAQLTGDGRKVAFTSSCDFVPGSNPEGHDQLFLRDVSGAMLMQLSPADPSGGLGPGYPPEGCLLSSDGTLAVDHDGARVVAIAQCHSSRTFRMRVLDYSTERGLRIGSWVPCGLRILPNGLSANGNRVVIEGFCHPVRGRRRTNLQRLYVQDAPRRGFKRLGRGRCASFMAGLNDDGLVTFNSNCPEYVGSNPDRIVQLIALDRASGEVRKLTSVPGTGCGGFSLQWEGIIVPPAVSGAGHVAIAALCTDAAGPALPSPPPELVFMAGPGGDPQNVTFDFCIDRPEGNDGSLGYSTINAPVSLSGDASTIALTTRCGVGPFPESERRVLVVRPPDISATLAIVSYPDPAGAYDLSPPSMDAAGNSLAFATDAPIGGCGNNHTHQLYVARGLDDPTPAPTICACQPGT